MKPVRTDMYSRRNRKMKPTTHTRGPVPPDAESEASYERDAEPLEEVDKEEISIDAHIKISGKEAENYKDVLKSLGYSTALDRFTVDSRGNSPELKEELGEDYLDNKIIIVSEGQLNDLSLLPGNPSYMGGVISEIPRDLVKKIVPYEALVGKVNILYGAKSVTGFFDSDFKDLASYSDKGLHVALVLDTLTEAVKKMDFLNNKINFIKEGSLKQLDKKLLESILTEIHPLTTKYGSIEPIRNLNTGVDIPIGDAILYFNHKGYDVFLFNGSEPFLVYHGEKNIKSESSVKVLRSSDRPQIIDLLVKNEFLRIEKENLSDSLGTIAKSVLKDQVPDHSELTGFQFYKTFKKFKDEPVIVEELKEANWYLLRDVCYDKVEFTSLPLEVKEMITKPRDEFVDEYLKLLDEKTSAPR